MTSELPVTQAWAVSDWEMAKQQGFKQAISALEQPTPELVEAVARGIVKRNFPNMPDIDVDEMWDGYAGDAKAALAAAAAHLGKA